VTTKESLITFTIIVIISFVRVLCVLTILTLTAALPDTYSYVALYEMALEEFSKDNPQLKEVCLKATEGVEAACFQSSKHSKAESVKQANSTLLETLTTAADLITVFQELEKQRSKNAMFKAMMNCIHRVEAILLFVAATRNADLELHLKAGEQLSKLFFAFGSATLAQIHRRHV